MYDVVLVDDEQIILTGLSQVFPWAQYGCRVVDTAADGHGGLACIRKRRPQILFTDIRMPNMDGLNMIAALRSEFPTMQIAVLTAFRDFDYAQRAIQLGVCRYLLKPSRMEELHEAVSVMTRNLAALEPDGSSAGNTILSTEQNPPDAKAASDEAQRRLSPSEDSDAGGFVVRAALRFMEEHCAEHLTLADVADHVYVSQWHLSKLINRYAQLSFFDLLNRYRVERSQAMLTDPMYKVNEIAYAVGYTDVAHFSRIFKKITGKPPWRFGRGCAEAWPASQPTTESCFTLCARDPHRILISPCMYWHSPVASLCVPKPARPVQSGLQPLPRFRRCKREYLRTFRIAACAPLPAVRP